MNRPHYTLQSLAGDTFACAVLLLVPYLALLVL